MAKRDEMRQALVAGDVGLLWRMWATWFPGCAQPANWQEAEIQLHVARAQTKSVPVKFRCYSHHWLIERGLPSTLPDELKPKAEQFKPVIASAVGFSWSTHSRIMKPAEPLIVKMVTQRIEEMAADGLLERDPDGVRREMMFTKNRTLHSLFGDIASLTKETKHGKLARA